ncbi:unnamed protein product [Vicia faba]|uniref:Arabidopsis retrotransposon Orf1 C-terminal domain-containing protein n=1 Tax=Vicia faba TaxID=3906 RepID=A0AAV0ZRS3_VICFA|nr:unnamed protein product [Vicia faba]
MFNTEYQFTTDEIAETLNLPHVEGIPFEAPLWENEAFVFLNEITSLTTNSIEGNNASAIHNPSIRYFYQMLADTIFSRDNTNKTNGKEMFYLQVALAGRQVNLTPFMIAHMRSSTSKRDTIMFESLITSLARSLDLDAQLDGLEPLLPRTLDI